MPRLHTSLTRELNARKTAAATQSGKIELLEDDGEVIAVDDEVLRRNEGKWRWEDWKGISWAGGWTGKAPLAPQLKDAAAPANASPSDEDGLGELQEWLWNLE